MKIKQNLKPQSLNKIFDKNGLKIFKNNMKELYESNSQKKTDKDKLVTIILNSS